VLLGKTIIVPLHDARARRAISVVVRKGIVREGQLDVLKVRYVPHLVARFDVIVVGRIRDERHVGRGR
jgi:hypothetical protein